MCNNIINIIFFKGTEITTADLDNARNSLKSFVADFQRLYGLQSVTMNVHLLRHVTDSVEKLGPLWSYSMFSFESMNGRLLKLANGTQATLQQIVEKYILKKVYPICLKDMKSENEKLYGKSEIEITAFVSNLLSWNNIDVAGDEKLSIYSKLKKDKIIYTSKNYKLSVKTADYFLRFTDLFGKVQYYFKKNNCVYIVVEEFIVIDKKSHILEVAPSHNISIKTANEIVDKFIYMQLLSRHFVAIRPNTFEH